MASGNFLRMLRITILLYVLLFVAAGAWLARARTTDWDDTLWVGVYPINGDGSAAAAGYINDLEAHQFDDIEQFVKREATRYGIDEPVPVSIELGQPIAELPPPPPADRNIARVMLWSLNLRYWAWRKQWQQPGPHPDIRVYMVFYDPQQNETLAHSLGLQKGLLGVVNAFASARMTGSNNVVLAHEILHTLGATDKYDPATALPHHPEGYAEPLRRPLYPQLRAEIMGGRIPTAPGAAVTPRSLSQVIVGPVTAAEIRWMR